jgi:LysR family tcuABC transcriptional regulator
MDIRQLRYFVAVMEAGTVSRAAEMLNIVQPALSQQLGRLERELGCKLLIRSTKGVVPNEAGRAFYDHARFVLRQLDAARDVVRSKAGAIGGPISVGLAPSTGSILGMPLLREFRRRYPEVVLTVIEALSGHLEGQLISRLVDVAILFTDRLPADVERERLFSERLFLIRRARGRQGRAKSITLRQALGHPLVVPTRSHGLRKELELVLGQQGLAPEVVAEIDSLPLLLETVADGIGATIQPWSALGRAQRRGLCIEEIRDPQVARTNYLCSAPQTQLSPTATAARALVRDVALRLVASGEWKGVKA